MESIITFFTVLIVCIFLLIYKNRIKINLPFVSTIDPQNKEVIKAEKRTFPWKNWLLRFSNICIFAIMFSFLFRVGTESLNFVKESVWTSPYDPVARFTTKLDWENRIIKLDASMSKSYKNKFKKFIWRIDDGESSVGAQVQHQFKHPGYYTIKLSVIDSFDKSDQATCHINIPPSKIKKITYNETVDLGGNSENGVGKLTTIEKYKYLPDEIYFNYSKRYAENDSASDLQSPSISNDCGLSEVSYNSRTDNDITSILKKLLDLMLAHIVAFALLFFIRRFFLSTSKEVIK